MKNNNLKQTEPLQNIVSKDASAIGEYSMTLVIKEMQDKLSELISNQNEIIKILKEQDIQITSGEPDITIYKPEDDDE